MRNPMVLMLLRRRLLTVRKSVRAHRRLRSIARSLLTRRSLNGTGSGSIYATTVNE